MPSSSDFTERTAEHGLCICALRRGRGSVKVSRAVLGRATKDLRFFLNMSHVICILLLDVRAPFERLPTRHCPAALEALLNNASLLAQL